MAIPILRWVGGKTKLLPQIKQLMPKEYNDYYEPFFGGGALFFDLELKDKKAVINDLNKDLMNVYIQVKDNPEVVLYSIEEQIPLLVDKNYYLLLRNRFNEKLKNEEYDVELARLLILLNLSSFNSLYRKNKQGYFNTSHGTITRIAQTKYESVANKIKNASIVLNNNVDIYNSSFDHILKMPHEKDFVFIDSPYIDTFDRYTGDKFSIKDQEKLAQLCKELDSKGVYFIATNSDTETTRSLYKDFNCYNTNIIYTVGAKNVKPSKELIITNIKQ